MASYWNTRNHVSIVDAQYPVNNDAQNFTLFVEDFQSSVAIQDSASVSSSMSRPSTLRTCSSESGLSFASQTTVSTTSKRSRRESHDYDGDRDAHYNTLRPQKRVKKIPSAENEPTQLFACPYAKYEPSRYSAANLQELNYRSCSKCYLTDIARVKQHLYRVHERPKFHCSRCFQVFENQSILLDHVFSKSCAPQECPFEEKMTAEQSAIIKKKTRGADPYLTWYEIYRTLFPDASPPPAPYATFANQGSETLDAFTQYVQDRLPQRLSEQLVDIPMREGFHREPMVSTIETYLATIMSELRFEFGQSMQRNGSPISFKASPVTREASPVYLSMDSNTEYIDEDSSFRNTSDNSEMQRRDHGNDESFGSDNMINDIAMELYGPPTAIHNPQVASAVTSDVGDYFAGFHQAVTVPY